MYLWTRATSYVLEDTAKIMGMPCQCWIAKRPYSTTVNRDSTVQFNVSRTNGETQGGTLTIKPYKQQ